MKENGKLNPDQNTLYIKAKLSYQFLYLQIVNSFYGMAPHDGVIKVSPPQAMCARIGKSSHLPTTILAYTYRVGINVLYIRDIFQGFLSPRNVSAQILSEPFGHDKSRLLLVRFQFLPWRDWRANKNFIRILLTTRHARSLVYPAAPVGCLGYLGAPQGYIQGLKVKNKKNIYKLSKLNSLQLEPQVIK